MQTPGHVIINLGLLGGGDRPRWTWPIIAGALIPDLMMFWFYVWTKLIRGLPDGEIWRTTYFLDSWQNIFDLFNSIPLALVGLGLALYCRQGGSHQGGSHQGARPQGPRPQPWAGPAIACFASIIFHCLQDLPLHHDDGHRHFWPLSNFRFASPVSYWDPNHYAIWGALFEVVCVVAATALILRWLKSPWGRGILIFLAVLYIALYLSLYGPTVIALVG
ncbi:MAG: hypothetical protein HC824_07450 [Synechococcales cyanobacterium RM1_1_8]|nr:hypothetical protein [Synechococcales cyanobacterium RM1_1_8]